jgi:tRNA (adenine57-N1/adenine58-N1)-methyltransferase
MTGIFSGGDRILLVDSKDRRYVVVLKSGGEFHSHKGFVLHDDVIGVPEGSIVKSTQGVGYRALRPTLADFILKMPRGAQVIYPKDLGPILMMADIHPGVRVLESGVGSGALSMTLLRAGAIITGYELREDFASRAVSNVTSFLGEEALERYDVQVRDAYEGVDPPGEAGSGEGFDRMVLDLPEPWQMVPHALDVLEPGGIIIAYTPSITQVSRFRDAMIGTDLTMAETTEVLNRTWHVEGQAVRPDHRMVAHTGFLTTARRLPG